MKIIGITGGVGSGKSEVLRYLEEEYGAVVCEADLVAKNLQKRVQSVIIKSLSILERTS